MMKRILIILVLSALASIGARAQDSLNLARMDSTYVGKSILSVIGPGAEINQTTQVRQAHPETGVYRSFETPNYKVTIGDFRTKDEALRIYNALKGTYPTAYIIKENINFPR